MILDIPVCACGVGMVHAHNDNYFICDNCDVIQPIQYTVVRVKDGVREYHEREKTVRDKKYDATMKARIDAWFD